MSTKPSPGSPHDDANRTNPARPGSDDPMAEIQRLEAELAVLRKAAGMDRNEHARYCDNLTTVKVPEQFKAPFLRAQQYVADYFSNRIEHPDTATILIAGERYVLLRAASLSVEFVEMVTKLYQDAGEEAARNVANNLLFDLAHALGKADARSFQKKMGVNEPIDNLSAGPIHFAFSGWAFVDISAESRPSPDENYFLLYEHPYSFESHSWLAKNKKSKVPVCMMNAGYSSGWCEESFGLPLVAVETECLAAGGERCRFIMAPPARIEEHLARHSRRGSAPAAAGGRHPIAVPEFFQRKRLEAELREANDQLEQRVQKRTHELESANEQLRLLGSAVENATEGFVIMEFVDGPDPLRITFVNQGFGRITGYTAQEVVGQSLKYLRISNNESSIFEALFGSIRRGDPFEAQLTAIRRDGSPYALEIHVMAIHGTGLPTHWIGILRDISDRKAHIDALKYQALHDALTGLPNRLLLHDRIEQGIADTWRTSSEFALAFLDLDGFKEINDTFGHQVGDVLLTMVGTRLRAHLHAADTIARLGGDEFAIVLGAQNRLRDAERLGTQLLAALAEPFVVEDHTLVVGGSIGIVHCPQHGTDPNTLMRRADVAMYAAKAAHAGVMTYSPRQDSHSPARLQLIAEIRGDVDSQHMDVHYQPQIDLVTGNVARAEALVRWKRPDGSLLLPDEFLPFVESSDVIDRIFRAVLDRAIGDCRRWHAEGLPIGISVNLAAHNLRDNKLVELIEHMLIGHGLASQHLTLEITERGILGDVELASGIFNRLRELGVGLSIDDFGTGYSSLMRLKHLPLTELKIDRLFTSEMLANEQDAAIVRSTIDLGHELGCSIVAEGVEKRELLDRLREYGCDFAQGYFICRPMQEDALREWLRRPRKYDDSPS
ncbi:MAG: EAL domain-containing protein [Rudaea sp.]|nr:EAL domain-containing protein [Rudaea sp.]